MSNIVQKKLSMASSNVDMSILDAKLGYQIRMAERIINRDFGQNVGITPVQYSVFALVAQNEGLSQVAIGESLKMDRASTMAIVDKLQLAGLIERRQSANDKRTQALYLTVKGKSEFKLYDKKVLAHDRSFSDQLSAQALENLIAAITALRSK